MSTLSVAQNDELRITISGYEVEKDIGVKSKPFIGSFYSTVEFNDLSVTGGDDPLELDEYASDKSTVSVGYQTTVDMGNGYALFMFVTNNLAGGTDYLRVALAKLGDTITWCDYLTLKSWAYSGGTVWYPGSQSVALDTTTALLYRRTSGSANSDFDIVKVDTTTETLSILSADNSATDNYVSAFCSLEDSTGGDARVLELWCIANGAYFGTWKGRVHTINKTTGAVTTGTTYTQATLSVGYCFGVKQVTYISDGNVLLAFREGYVSYGAGHFYFAVISVDDDNVVAFGTFAYNTTSSGFLGFVMPIEKAWLDTARTEMLVPINDSTNYGASFIYISISGTTITAGAETRYPDYTAGTTYRSYHPHLIMASETTGVMFCRTATTQIVSKQITMDSITHVVTVCDDADVQEIGTTEYMGTEECGTLNVILYGVRDFFLFCVGSGSPSTASSYRVHLSQLGLYYGFAGMRFNNDDANFIEIGRRKNTLVDKYYALSSILGVETIVAQVDTTDTSGEFKITRTGNTIAVYYDVTGTWTLLYTFSDFRAFGPCYIELFCRAEATIDMFCDFDDFIHFESSNSIYPEHILDEGDYPLNISKSGARNYNNKIIVDYKNREKDYAVGTAIADDGLDIEDYGLKEKTLSLDGLTTNDRAIKMANMYLKKSLVNPEAITFKLGINNLDIRPGDIKFLTDPDTELDSQPIRILTVGEDDEYGIEIEAECEHDIYEFVDPNAIDNLEPETVNLTGASLNITKLFAIEIPACYSLSACKIAIGACKDEDDDACAGYSLYKSYATGGNFTRIDISTIEGLLGDVTAVVADTSITVELETDATLTSATSFDELLQTPQLNLMVVRTQYGDKFIRFQDADLISANTWLLTGLLYDVTGFPYKDKTTHVSVGDQICIYSGVTFRETLLETDKNRALFFKVPTYNYKGDELSLAECDEYGLTTTAMCDTPLAPYFTDVNGLGINSTKAVTLGAGDIALTWMSRNRFFEGSTNYTDSNAIAEDIDFSYFRVLIYDGATSTLLRTVEQTAKTYTYTTALQTTDGGPYSSYIIKIYQVNTTKDSTTYDLITLTMV